jgi:DNA mismatch repair protein MutL
MDAVEKKEVKIKVLDPRTVGMISAGEVVERPASVVKELVENALDAGSSRISIELRNGGKDLIRVVDNGIGMNEEELLLALERHSTSKIRSFSDLEEITTLGFRGEALPSIAAVSRMKILSKSEDEEMGREILVHGGEIVSADEASRGRGTTVTIRDIFYNTPARKKFLKTTGTELRNIIQTVTESALSNLAVTFILRHNGKCLLESEATDNLLERTSCLFSREDVLGMVPVKYQQDGVEIYGLISRPEDIKKGVTREYTFVNGRSIRSSVVRKAVRRSFRATLKTGLKPDYFLFLKVSPASVDVNIHPMKREVKFKDEEKIVDLLETSASQALSSPESIPSYEKHASHVDLHERGKSLYGQGSGRVGRVTSEVDQMSFFFTDTGKPVGVVEELPQLEEADDEVYYPSMVQVHNTFIIVQTRKGILILDQHASHERVLYERLLDSFAGSSLTSQKLLFPLTFHLSPSQYSTVMEFLSLFRTFGFEIEPFGGKSVIVHSTPSLHQRFEVETAFREMVEELAESAQPEMKQHEQMAKVIACKAALKAGQPLSKKEMCELFDTLFSTRVPSRDIHGRPTMVQIGIDELRKRFERG